MRTARTAGMGAWRDGGPSAPGASVTARLGALALRHRRPSRLTGALAAVAAVALATLTIYLLRTIAPVVSLSVVYLPAVLLISTYWGLGLGLCTSLLSAAAFNFFHLPPTGTFAIFSGRNWVALGAFTIVAVFVSTIAEVARARALEAESRRAEADLAAALARELLLGVDTSTALAGAARRVAEGLGLSSASIQQGEVPAASRGLALALRGADGLPVATLLVPPGLTVEAEQRLRAKVVPTLEALVAIADRRDALQAERVETEALRRSDELKTALLRAVSHDLRTPLTAIVAAGHALSASSLTDDERAELSAAVVEEGNRLAGLVDNLLALSRLQAGAATPRRDWVSVEDLLTEALEGLRPRPSHLRLDIQEGLPEVSADPAQLERAFANLLENACRYGGTGPVTVAAHADRDRIFEPFYRGREAARAGSGSGLGLAIARGFVQANGGEIRVEPGPGGGARFEVLLRVILRDAGYEALPASSGEEALDVAAVSRPSAAIVDLLLPDIDGVAVCRRLREWSDMPLIVLSAVGDEDAKVRALAAGADDYVTKPFGPRELIARLEASLRRVGPDRDDPVIVAGELTVDLAARLVTLGGEPVHLTPTEFDLLRILASNRGRLMTHRELLVSVWGAGYADDTQVLRAHIANLRRKLEPRGGPGRAPAGEQGAATGQGFIRTDPGVGYRFSG